MSVSTNLVFFRGEDIVLDFALPVPTNITGWTIAFQLAARVGGTVLIAKAAVIVNAVQGTFRVTLDSADTASLSPGVYPWDCRREDAGAKATLADGWLTLRREVTG
jgi:hypothetical protein